MEKNNLDPGKHTQSSALSQCEAFRSGFLELDRSFEHYQNFHV